MTRARQTRKGKSLASGRPPLATKKTTTLSSKATRTIIRRHHVLSKEHDKALKAGHTESAAAIAEQLLKNGGLEQYQQASQTGQLTARGGDTSKALVLWLQEEKVVTTRHDDSFNTIRLLEVGCLSIDNAISRCSNVQLERIDLHSTHPQILEQDFMQRPSPLDDGEKFDIVSLSLVVNFVADAQSRGDMLCRTATFLRQSDAASQFLPALFLTLPLPCVINSRYLDVEVLTRIMDCIGYVLHKSKSSAKIFYSLWHYDLTRDKLAVAKRPIRKTEILSGPNRNNFYIAVS